MTEFDDTLILSRPSEVRSHRRPPSNRFVKIVMRLNIVIWSVVVVLLGYTVYVWRSTEKVGLPPTTPSTNSQSSQTSLSPTFPSFSSPEPLQPQAVSSTWWQPPPAPTLRQPAQKPSPRPEISTGNSPIPTANTLPPPVPSSSPSTNIQPDKSPSPPRSPNDAGS